MDSKKLEKMRLINKILTKYDGKSISSQTCEICLYTKNLIICENCKNYYHLKCLGLENIPIKFYCIECKEIFHPTSDFSYKSTEIGTIFDTKSTIGNRVLNCEFKQRSFKKESFTMSGKKTKRDSLGPPFNSFSYRENQENKEFDRYADNAYFNKDKKTKKTIINSVENVNNSAGRIERKELLAFENTISNYKRRKTKIGINHNIDMIEYYHTIENEINLENLNHERLNLKRVWSNSKNPLSKDEIDDFLKTAKIFWEYRNLNIENELNTDFQSQIITYMNQNYRNISQSMRNLIEIKLIELKKFLEKGINLYCHFDEMALKILYIAKYNTKLALFFIYKNLNPFIEEVESGFEDDVNFFQKEIISVLSDDFDYK